MRRAASCLALGGLALAAVGAAPAHLPEAQVDREVVGVLVDAASGVPVEGAQVVLRQTRLGTRSAHDGSFGIVGRPPPGWAGEIEVRHPCFHTVRVEVEPGGLEDPLVIGLPFRMPRSPDGTPLTDHCRAYGPNAPT